MGSAAPQSSHEPQGSAPQSKLTTSLYAIIAVAVIDWILSFFDLNFLPSILVVGDRDYTNYAVILGCFAYLKTIGSKQATSEVSEQLRAILNQGEYSLHQQRVTLKSSLLKGELGILVGTNERLLFFKIADVNGDNTEFLAKPELLWKWQRSELKQIEGGALNLTFLDASDGEFKFQVGLGQASKWVAVLNGSPDAAPVASSSASGTTPSSPSLAASGRSSQEILDKARSVAEEALKAGQAWADKSLKASGGMDGIKNKANLLKEDVVSGKFKRDVIAGNPESIKILAAAVGGVLLLAFMIFGAGDKNISTVRNGVMKDFSKSKTVADALEKSGVISGGKWTSFKADTGERIVEFSGTIKNIDKRIATVMKEGEKELNDKGAGFLFALANPYLKLFDTIKIDSCVYAVQFAINAHDRKSFELHASQLTVRAAPNGQVKEGLKKLLSDELTITDDEGAVIKAIYEADADNAAMVVKGLVLKPIMTAGALMQ